MQQPTDDNPAMGAATGGAPHRSPIATALHAFGRFWWDFLIGDTPELFLAVVILMGVIAVLAKEVSSTTAWIVEPVLVIAALVASVLRGRND